MHGQDDIHSDNLPLFESEFSSPFFGNYLSSSGAAAEGIFQILESECIKFVILSNVHYYPPIYNVIEPLTVTCDQVLPFMHSSTLPLFAYIHVHVHQIR